MEVLAENAQYYVEELESDLRASRSREETERLLYDLSHYHRILAVGKFFAAADLEAFTTHLRRSADLRIELLQSMHSTARPAGRFTCASQIAPFFDALTADDFTLAEKIAVLSPEVWLEDDEFEDDFWYARFLYSLILSGLEPTEETTNALGNLKRVKADNTLARTAICTALANGDQNLFDESIERMIEERTAYNESKVGRLIPNRLDFQTGRHLYLEGLALLRLAEHIGIATAPEYPLMPRLARLPTST